MEIVCTECRKQRDVLYPELWRYKIGSKYFCSWGCLRKGEQKMGKITLEMKKKAVQIALDGGNPFEYLESCGSKNPHGLWWTIKQNLKVADPDKYAKLPNYKPGPAEGKLAVDKGMPKKIGPDGKEYERLELEAGGNYQLSVAEDQMDKLKIDKPLMHSGKKAIGWEGDFGTYVYDRKQGYIDYESNDGDEISMPVDAWREWWKEIREVWQLMGVEL